jgi:hypothetical protein
MAAQGFDLLFTPDLAETGVRELLRSLAHPARQLFFHSFDAMRLRVSNNIVSLALRRYLAGEEIPHQLAASISFTEADQYDLTIGGRRCIPAAQLACGDPREDQVYLPIQRGGSLFRDVDIYLFFRLAANVTRSWDETEEILFAGKPVCLVHQMPEMWASPEHWDGLDRLAVKTDTSGRVILSLHGLDLHRAYRKFDLETSPRRRIVLKTGLFSIGAASAESYPAGPIGLFSGLLDDLHLIHPHTWGNIWVYGDSITGLGYITKAAFDRQARRVSGPEMESTNPRLGEDDYLCVPRSALTPLDDLFPAGAGVGCRIGLLSVIREVIDLKQRYPLVVYLEGGCFVFQPGEDRIGPSQIGCG